MYEWIFFQFFPYFSISSSKRALSASVHLPDRFPLMEDGAMVGYDVCIADVYILYDLRQSKVLIDDDSNKFTRMDKEDTYEVRVGVWRKGYENGWEFVGDNLFYQI